MEILPQQEQQHTPWPLDYRMPAEWSPQEAIWFSWPRPEGISFPGRYQEVLPQLVNFITAVGATQLVRINVASCTEEDLVKKLLLPKIPAKNLECFLIPTDEPWCRDHGPIFIINEKEKKVALLNWQFNAWGKKYHPFERDNNVPPQIATALNLPLFSPPMVLEGGSIEVNGQGTLLTTTSCLLHPNRNPHLSQEEIEIYLRHYLGVKDIIWLGEGIEGDDTDGHIDDITRFVGPNSVITCVQPDSSDPNHIPLEKNKRLLEELALQEGKQLEVIPLLMPPRLEYEGNRLPASYANFLITNHSVLLPGYSAQQDEQARGILQELFPERNVQIIEANILIWGLGAFHCLSQQQPAIEG